MWYCGDGSDCECGAEASDGEEPVGIDWSLYEDTSGLGMYHDLNVAVIEPSPTAIYDRRRPAVPLVDWDSLQVQEEMEEEGMIEICSEQQLYSLLGLKEEDDKAEQMAREAASNSKAGITTASGIPNAGGPEGVSMPAGDHTPKETVIEYDKDNPCMDLGTIYPNMAEFRLAMRQFAINKEFELGIEATCTKRYRGYCKGDDCPWAINGHRQADGVTVMVTVLNDVHTCTSSSKGRTTRPSSKWVASKAVSILRKNPLIGCKELQVKLQDDHKCRISYDTVWKGKEKALEFLYGTWQESFQLLHNWKAEILKRSPDSVVEIECKLLRGRVYFHRFFCALGPSIEGFRSGCRPWLGIGSTVLNGPWNGHLVAATGVDGHNWMYPVAFGFIDSETEDNWVWFMAQLQKAIGECPLLAICTDACKGLENVVKQVFPQAEQRECFKHLMQNFMKRYSGENGGHMWPAARAYDKNVYEQHMSLVYSDNPEAKKWLEKHHKLKWTRSDFNPNIKCDFVTNNVAEVFNNWIKDIKDLPVVELADKIKEMTMVLFNKRRRIGEILHGRILPAVLQMLKSRTKGLGYLSVIKCDDYAAEVWDNCNRFVVKPYLRECSCLEWQHTGKPCRHALSLITAQQVRNMVMEDFVHEYYSVPKFSNAYARWIEPLPDKLKWPNVELPVPIGTPLSKRVESGSSGSKSSAKVTGNENGKTKKMIRGKARCPNCGQLGHRKASSKCPLNETKKRKRKPRKNSTKGWIPKELRSDSQITTTEQIMQAS